MTDLSPLDYSILSMDVYNQPYTSDTPRVGMFVGNAKLIAHVVGDLAQARAKLPSMRSRTALSEVLPERRAVPVMERYPAWI
jgi:hypothetical protein